MHLQIVEADRQLTRRYVAHGPHCWAMCIGLTESRSAGGTEQAAGMLSGQLFGPGGDTTPEYWIDGRRIRAARKAPPRKRPCCSRALSVDPSRSSFRCAQPILRGGSITHEMLGVDCIACSASSAGRVKWVERSETHPRVA